MSDFKNANTFSLNDVHGFCMSVPQWTRTQRSSLKGWRYDMRWERNEKKIWELVVWLMEDNQHQASYETGMLLWRLALPEARPGSDSRYQHQQVETEAEFKVANFEWVLGQGLCVTLKAEIDKRTDEMRLDLKRALAENKDGFEQLEKAKEAQAAASTRLDELSQKLNKTNKTNEAQRNVLALAEHALTVRGKAKVKAEAKVKALEALKELHEATHPISGQEWGRGPDSVDDAEPYTGCMGDPDSEPPYVVRKCWFETTPAGNLLDGTAALVAAASGLTPEAALKTVYGNRNFVVLPDRWDAFDTGLKQLGVDVCVESTDPPVAHYECWFTEQVTKEKIRVIKTVREFSGLGLKEAKDATECNGHFFISTRCWSGWQEEIAKLPEARWTYKFTKAVTCER